uniref:Uncharacterized protein n=1 Tax=Proboscia inermis TaxID=420281 RepID=A0A7S0BV70_9STRA|mmetsp:Transcript_38522/g.44895  ORF Transcript_38522/g.44895 Transcript_38522/m.44895 type:complete len:103 (-) Transcript_38522:355-663(-)
MNQIVSHVAVFAAGIFIGKETEQESDGIELIQLLIRDNIGSIVCFFVAVYVSKHIIAWYFRFLKNTFNFCFKHWILWMLLAVSIAILLEMKVLGKKEADLDE